MKKQTKRFCASMLALLLTIGCVFADLGSNVLIVNAAEQATVSSNDADMSVSQNDVDTVLENDVAQTVSGSDAVSDNDAEIALLSVDETVTSDDSAMIMLANETTTTKSGNTKTLNFTFSEKLEVGKNYMDGMLSVGTEMTYTSGNATLKDIAGNDAGSVSGYVTNKTNPNTGDGTGALLRFTPKYDGTIQAAAQLGAGKTFKIVTADGTEVYSYENGATKLDLKLETVEVKAGTTYYLFGKGTKARFYSLDYVYEEEVKTVLVNKTNDFVFTEKLEADKTYMDGMLSVGTEMTYTSGNVTLKDIAGNDAGSVNGYVTNKTNPNTGDGTGALLRFTPKYDGTIQAAAQLGAGKTFKIVTADGAEVYSYENGATKLDLKLETVEVKAGTTYYLFGKGTKARFYSLTYKYQVEEEEKQEEELPKIELVEGVKAFDTAQGGGMYATGGRGGDVYVVTSLADDGSAGTLRYGINTAPAEGRIIVFNVGGTIHLKDSLNLTDNITIAGQTAPGEGITIAGYDTNISEDDNLIIRFVHFRPGTAGLADGGDSIDALWGRDNDTFIIDHCSFSWNTDECLSTYRGQNGTVQYCIISESLTVSGHSKGRHGYGGIFGGDNTVFQYNLIADHTSRNPRVGGGFMNADDPEHVATLQISNNVTYNYGYFACYGGGNAYTNYVNNYLKVGPGTRETLYGTLIDYGEGGDHIAGVYIAGNVVENADGSKETDNTKGVSINQDGGTTWAKSAYEKDGFASVNPVSAEAAYARVLAQAGVTYPKRDAIDSRVIQQVEDGTGAFINTQDDVGGYCAPEVYRDASFDTDLDGIPDAWETAHGLNPNDKTDSRNLNKDGYAWVEVYFNELVAEVTSANYVAKNPEVTIDLTNNAMVDEGKDVTVTATANATNGGSIAKVVFFNGADAVATVENAPFSYTYSGLADGTYDISVRAYDNEGNATQSETSKLHINSTAGTGDWKLADIGTPGVKSAASYVDGVMTVKGAGKLGKGEGTVRGSELNDATTDDFAFVYQEFTGDMEIVTKLDSYKVVDAHTFNGLMFRESLEDDAATVGLGLSMVKVENSTIWSAFMVDREKDGGNMTAISETIDSAAAAANAGIPMVQDLKFKTGDTFNGTWLKLSREGNNFIGYVSEDGVTWKTVGTLTVDMDETVYVGFAVDANKVGNELENYATAYFSNIEINTSFVNVTYDVADLTVEGANRIAAGKDLAVQFKNIRGYLIPENIEIICDTEVDYTYDAENGTLLLKNLTEDLTVKAVGIKRVVEMVNWEEVDADNLLTVEEKDDKLILTQTATSGIVATYSLADKVPPTPAVNQSFLLFPETKNDYTLSMTVKITDLINIDGGKNNGLFVGAFATDSPAFTTLGFRACGKDSLSAYWFKADKAGNGSPKYVVAEDMEYKVTFGTNSNGQYYVSWESEDGSVKDTKAFKINENYMQHGEKARYGIGILGATVEISDMKLVDHEDNVIYVQNAQADTPDVPRPTPGAGDTSSDSDSGNDDDNDTDTTVGEVNQVNGTSVTSQNTNASAVSTSANNADSQVTEGQTVAEESQNVATTPTPAADANKPAEKNEEAKEDKTAEKAEEKVEIKEDETALASGTELTKDNGVSPVVFVAIAAVVAMMGVGVVFLKYKKR